MSLFSLLTVIFSLLTVIFSLLTVIFSLLTPWKPYTARLSDPLKKEKKKKRKKEKRFFMKNSPMPSLKLGRFNLAKARLRGCFFSNDHWEPKAEKSKSNYELASLVFFQKQKPSIVKIIEQPVFLKAVFQGGNKRTFFVSLVDTR